MWIYYTSVKIRYVGVMVRSVNHRVVYGTNFCHNEVFHTASAAGAVAAAVKSQL